MELTPQKKDPSGERNGRLTPLVFPCRQEELRQQGRHSARQPCCLVPTSVADRRAFRPGQLPSVHVRGRERERGGGGGGCDDDLGFDGCHGHGLRDLGFNRGTFRSC
ncbi:unnamed protein product [Sphagnum balticum]